MNTLIKHRVNTLRELKMVDSRWGVEIDLRSDVKRKERIHLSHDPWRRGVDFEVWLKSFKKKGISGPLFLNTKEDGLETKVVALMKKYGIGNYVFLDTQLPTLVRWAIKKRNKHFAIRLSRYEAIESLRPFVGKVAWVWVDCFDGQPLSARLVKKIRNKFKICLVSPELQMKSIVLIKKFRSLKRLAHAVCTKYPRQWEDL
ncbi:MAG: hypothetical protein KCHDKBKB_00459 [Elusimicrobia bacterium]|nr:hypothetical protein [Elusimicrobiota bacterium]